MLAADISCVSCQEFPLNTELLLQDRRTQQDVSSPRDLKRTRVWVINVNLSHTLPLYTSVVQESPFPVILALTIPELFSLGAGP